MLSFIDSTDCHNSAVTIPNVQTNVKNRVKKGMRISVLVRIQIDVSICDDGSAGEPE